MFFSDLHEEYLPSPTSALQTESAPRLDFTNTHMNESCLTYWLSTSIRRKMVKAHPLDEQIHLYLSTSINELRCSNQARCKKGFHLKFVKSNPRNDYKSKHLWSIQYLHSRESVVTGTVTNFGIARTLGNLHMCPAKYTQWQFNFFVLPPHSSRANSSRNGYRWCAVIRKPGSAWLEDIVWSSNATFHT